MFAYIDLNGSRALGVFNAITEALTQGARQMESWLLDKKTIAISSFESASEEKPYPNPIRAI